MSAGLPERCELVSWGQVRRWSRNVAARVRTDGPPDLVVAIARGGYVPARLVCDYLDLTWLESIRLVHYDPGGRRRRGVELATPLHCDIRGRRVLLMDDVADTGDTLEMARDHLLSLGPASVRVAVLLHKQGARLRPDVAGHHIRRWRWTTFPWAAIEDLGAFVAALPRRPATPAEARAALREHLGLRVPEALLRDVLQFRPG